jgi:hypothetical protein
MQTAPAALVTRVLALGEWSAVECLRHLLEVERFGLPVCVHAVLAGPALPAHDPEVAVARSHPHVTPRPPALVVLSDQIPSRRRNRMNVALWIVAGLLSVVLLISSVSKLFVPKERLAGMVGDASRWVEDFSPGALKAIAVLEFLGAVGLILPAALDIAPVLVPLAASGVVVLFVGAVSMRLRRGERATIVGDLIYLVMAAFVAWGRFGPESFAR